MASIPRSLDAVRAVNTAALEAAPKPLVGVFTGGTSGIGDFAVRAFAGHAAAQPSGARIYVVGRKKAAADAIFADYAAYPNVRFHFIAAENLSLMHDVDCCCAAIKQLEDEASSNRIDFLVMSHADLHLGERRETSEGLDQSYALLYYSRVRFAMRLMPLLSASVLPSARVISVYAAGSESSKFFADDYSLRQPEHYSFAAVRNHTIHLKTMAFETLAAQNPRVSFVHVFPALVITPGFDNNPLPLWFRVVWKLMLPVTKLISVKPDEIGQRVLGFALDDAFGRQQSTTGTTPQAMSTNNIAGGGAYSVKYNGKVNNVDGIYKKLRPEHFQDKVWQHTTDAFATIEAGKVFEK